MSEKEQLLENFLYDNDISCSTCKWWNKNAHKKNFVETCCIKEELRLTGAYNGTLLAIPPFGKSMCSHWMEAHA